MAKASLKPKSHSVPADDPQRSQSSEPSAVDLDRIIHEKTRLAIVSALAVSHTLSFNELKQILKTTDGNVSVHTRKLEDAKYLSCKKSFEGRMPRTEYSLTPAGRRALEKYVDHMEAVIRTMRRKE